MNIAWLGDAPLFPPVEHALSEPNGLLAVGGRLEPEWLLAAYRRGIFPWFSPGDPILWWSPDPRMVVFPAEFTPRRSLRKVLRHTRIEVRLDHDFAATIRACAAPRRYANGTWIVPAMQQAYIRLHRLGHAHSIESWLDGELVGGLYGVSIGRVFFGESMFSRVSDASKIAFAYLCRFLEHRGFRMIDCQMSTPHLQSLGGREIPRRDFIAGLERWTMDGEPPGSWKTDSPLQVDWS